MDDTVGGNGRDISGKEVGRDGSNLPIDESESATPAISGRATPVLGDTTFSIGTEGVTILVAAVLAGGPHEEKS